MLYCTQYERKNSAVATGLEMVSFHSNPNEGHCQRMFKLLHSFHMLARLCSKSFKLTFSSSWTKNFQMGQAGFRKSRGTRGQLDNICYIIEKPREFQKNIYFCFIDYAKDFDCGSQQTVENSSRDGNTRPPYLPPEKPVFRSRGNS